MVLRESTSGKCKDPLSLSVTHTLCTFSVLSFHAACSKLLFFLIAHSTTYASLKFAMAVDGIYDSNAGEDGGDSRSLAYYI